MDKVSDTFTGVIVCPLDRSNVDTDAIIPKQFLKVDQAYRVSAQPVRRMALPRQGEPGHGQQPAALQPGFSCSTIRATPGPASCWRAKTSAAGRRANTRPGRWMTTASRSSSHRASPTFLQQQFQERAVADRAEPATVDQLFATGHGR